MQKLLLLLCIIAGQISPQNGYFYSGKDYGSEALYNPLNLYLNGSYDIIQLEGHSRNIFKMPYAKSAKNVFDNLADPITAINKFGWWDFISNELFPFQLTKKKAQWWPNYQLHLIGGGMTFTAIKEYYEYHKIPYPYISSLITVMGYHLLNEIVENKDHVGINVDPIADIYFFNIGGIILFSFDPVNEFFSRELNLADWSLQPSFTYPGFDLHNNGQYFSVKWFSPLSEKLGFFYYFGMNGLTGVTYKLNNEESLSFGAGLRAKELILVNEIGRQNSLNMVWNFGFFYDRNNSLMTSVFFSGLTDYFCNVNVYPGIIKIGNFSPGLWTVIQKNGKILFGLSTSYAPGIGIR